MATTADFRINKRTESLTSTHLQNVVAVELVAVEPMSENEAHGGHITLVFPADHAVDLVPGAVVTVTVAVHKS